MTSLRQEVGGTYTGNAATNDSYLHGNLRQPVQHETFDSAENEAQDIAPVESIIWV